MEAYILAFRLGIWLNTVIRLQISYNPLMQIVQLLIPLNIDKNDLRLKVVDAVQLDIEKICTAGKLIEVLDEWVEGFYSE